MTPGECSQCGASAWDSRGRCRPCRAREARDSYARSTHERERRRLAKRAWRAANPEKVRAADRRKNYGVTQGRFDALFAAQRGVCAICKEREANSVDHCHGTGRIRALLCRACNAGLGLFGERPERLRAAAEYLSNSTS